MATAKPKAQLSKTNHGFGAAAFGQLTDKPLKPAAPKPQAEGGW